MAKHTTLDQLKKLATRTKTELDGLQTEIDALGGVYTPKGSCAFAGLETNASLDKEHLGHVWNITDGFETTENFLEGQGKSYPAGSNVAVIDAGDETYKYDVLSGVVDLSGYAKKDELVTYEDFTGASEEAGTHGLVPAPQVDNKDQFLKGDGTWATPVGTTYEDFTGADEGAGAHGLVPAPQLEDKEQFLKGDGTWATPYEDATQEVHGLMSTEDKTKLDGIETASDEEVEAMLTEIFSAKG